MNPKVIQFLIATGLIGAFVLYLIMQQNQEIATKQATFNNSVDMQIKQIQADIHLDKANLNGYMSNKATGRAYGLTALQEQKEIAEEKKRQRELKRKQKEQEKKSKQLLKNYEKALKMQQQNNQQRPNFDKEFDNFDKQFNF